MRKPFTYLLFLFALLICLTTSSSVATESLGNKDEGVQDVILEKEEILFCPWTRAKSGYCQAEPTITIKAIAKDAEKEGLEFYYFVSGGKILKNGANVLWDFSDSKPGQYSLTVGVGKNRIIKGKTVTKSFVFRECPECHIPCECPSISISSPTAPADAGDTLIFTVNLAGGSQDNEVYNWTVSEGKIIVGQQTPQILVKTTPEMKGRTITATVEVSGLCEVCLDKTATATAEIKDK
jgi:hypothetical protein